MNQFLQTVKIMRTWVEADKFANLVKEREAKLTATGGKQGFQIVNNLRLEWANADGFLRAHIGADPALDGWYIEDNRNGAGSPWTLYSPSGKSYKLENGLDSLLQILETVLAE